jgi:hypothetical protein
MSIHPIATIYPTTAAGPAQATTTVVFHPSSPPIKETTHG